MDINRVYNFQTRTGTKAVRKNAYLMHKKTGMEKRN